MDSAADQTPISAVRRRTSIETPTSLTLHTKHHSPSPSPSPPSSYTTTTTTAAATSSSSSSTSSSSSADYELVSLKPASYTSLRDILPPTAAAFVQSPKLPPYAAVHSGYEISIRNRLVKQAAWAYLQPMSTSPGAGGSSVFRRIWNGLSDAFFRIVSQICNCFRPCVQVTAISCWRWLRAWSQPVANK